MCQGHSDFLVSFPDPNNPSAECFQWEGGSRDLTGGNTDLWNADKSFACGVISVEFLKKSKNHLHEITLRLFTSACC